MRKLKVVFLALFFSLVFTTGCMDRRELNDLAILFGWGFDQNKKGVYEGSAQIIIPSKIPSSSGQSGGGGGGSEGYLLETGTGRDSTETVQNMQMKLSRVVFASHRRVIVFGENLAKNGLSQILDELSRNPDVRLRTDMFIVKGGTAKDFLSIPYKLEKIPVMGPLNIHRSIGGTETATFKIFLADSSSDGSNGVLPAMEIVNSKSNGDSGTVNATKTIKLAGEAVFNDDLKMVGYLTSSEATNRLWIRGNLKSNSITVYVPEGKGYVTFVGRKFKSKIKPVLQNSKVKFSVKLAARGTIKENNTNLDLKKTNNIQFIERALNQQVQKQVSQTISHVQKDFGLDVFGFGQAFHRKYPIAWRALKKSWKSKFAEADVAINGEILVDDVGSTGPSLQLKERKIIK